MKAKIEAFLQNNKTLSKDRQFFLESAEEFLDKAVEELSIVRITTGRTL